MLSRNVRTLLAGSCFLLAFALLFSFRAYDDNRLYSWQWLFLQTDVLVLYLLLIAALGISVLLAGIPVPEGREETVLAVSAYLAVVPLWAGPETIVDAARYFAQAKHLAQYGIGSFLQEWGRDIYAWTDLPLVPFCYGVLFRLFGEHRVIIQAFTTLLFSLTAVLTCRIGRRLWGRDTGFSAGLLLLGMPYLLTQVPLMLVDVPTMFLLALSLWSFLAAVERGGSLRTSLAVSAVILFSLAKFSSWPMLSLHGVTLPLLVSSRDSADRGPMLKRGMYILAAACLIVATILSTKLDVLSGQMKLLKDYQGPGLGRWGEGACSTFLFQLHPFITLLALFGAAVAVRKRDVLFAVIGWLPLLVLLFHIQRIRYIVPAFPLLALMAAYGMQSVREDPLRRFLVIGIVATTLTVSYAAYLPFARSMSTANLQRAGMAIDKLDTQEVEVFVVQSRDAVLGSVVSLALLDLYTHKELRYTPQVPEHRPPREERERSPLRFSWEFPVPRFYAASFRAGPAPAIAVVTSANDGPLPGGVADRLRRYRRVASMRSGEGIFQYAPTVDVYERMAGTGQ